MCLDDKDHKFDFGDFKFEVPCNAPTKDWVVNFYSNREDKIESFKYVGWLEKFEAMLRLHNLGSDCTMSREVF